MRQILLVSISVSTTPGTGCLYMAALDYVYVDL